MCPIFNPQRFRHSFGIQFTNQNDYKFVYNINNYRSHHERTIRPDRDKHTPSSGGSFTQNTTHKQHRRVARLASPRALSHSRRMEMAKCEMKCKKGGKRSAQRNAPQFAEASPKPERRRADCWLVRVELSYCVARCVECHGI